MCVVSASATDSAVSYQTDLVSDAALILIAVHNCCGNWSITVPMAHLWPSVGMDEDLGDVVATLYLDAMTIVADQEEKPDLWAEPETAHEGILQNELRDLHNALECEEFEQTGDIVMDHYAAALEVLSDQAEDDALWGPAHTEREACLKKELRLLHAVLEADWDMVEALEKLEAIGGLKPTVLH